MRSSRGRLSRKLVKVALLAWLAPGFSAQAKPPEYVPGQVIVRFKNDPKTLVQAQSASSGKIQFRSMKKLFSPELKTSKSVVKTLATSSKLDNVYLVETDARKIDDAIREIKKDSNVDYVEPNYIYHTVSTPNDPSYSLQYALPKISANLGWDVTTGSSSVIIAIVDTGIDLTHPDLAANIWTNPGEIPGDGIDNDGNGKVDDVHGWNFSYKNAIPQDDFGHGTHCAGIADARGNNGIGIAGVTWNAQLMAVKGLDSSGSGDTSELTEGILYAANNGAKVISNSWGGGGYSQTLENAINYAVEAKGATVVCAAGNNSSSELSYPAAYDNCIAVASTDQQDKVSWFSNFGYWVDVAAPGSDIYSTLPQSGGELGNNYGTLSGTSMACPTVSGMAAQLRARFPSYSATKIRDLIEYSVDPIDSNNPSYANLLGTGRINVNKGLITSAPINLPRHLISGVIRDADNVPAANVTVTISGAANQSTKTDAAGYFAFAGLKERFYTIRASDSAGSFFTPQQRTYLPLTADQTGQDFTISSPPPLPTVSIASPAENQVLSGIVVVSGARANATQVTLQFDGVPVYTDASSNNNWSYYLNTVELSAGTHVMTAIASNVLGEEAIATVSFVVQNPGNSKLDAASAAQMCAQAGSVCDSGSTLLSRGHFVFGYEYAAPNTINHSCDDGVPTGSGRFHDDESIDRIIVQSLDGSTFQAGQNVSISVSAWIKSTGEVIDVFTTTSTLTPAWTYLNSFTATSTGPVNATFNFTLASTALQAVRARLRPASSPVIPCGSEPTADQDDLVFRVLPAGQPKIAFVSPVNFSTVSKTVLITGTASDNVAVQKVDVQVDSGTASSAVGTSNWSFSLDTIPLFDGPHTITATVTDNEGNQQSAALTINVANMTLAAYDPANRTASCNDASLIGCSSGLLFNGRGTIINGIEPNQPNTVDACEDGVSGGYHNDESLDQMRVYSVDGTPLATGKLARIEARVWAYNASDILDFFVATTTVNPQWKILASQPSVLPGPELHAVNYVIPSSSRLVFRGQYRYGGSTVPCSFGGFNDRDDLVVVLKDTVPPIVHISSPVDGATISGDFNFTGTADDDVLVSKVELQFDNSDFINVVGTTHWSSMFATGELSSTVHSLTVRATDSSGNVGTQTIHLKTENRGSAGFDAVLKAPRCVGVGSFCDSIDELTSRGNMSGQAELNQPNTIRGTCADTPNGQYRKDSSVESLRLSTKDGTLLADGSRVTVQSVVNASENFENEFFRLYYATDATSPTWVLISAAAPGAAGQQSFATELNLSSGKVQALRAQYGILGSTPSACSLSGPVDQDDLIFDVADETRPTLTVSQPYEAQRVEDTLKVVGTASDNRGINRVEVRVDSGAPIVADGTENFSASINMLNHSNNVTTVYIRAYDDAGNYTETSVRVDVYNYVKATFDPFMQAPSCAVETPFCNSWLTLSGRGTGTHQAEAHGPNTVHGSCADGSSDSQSMTSYIHFVNVQSVHGEFLQGGGDAKVDVMVYSSTDSFVPGWVDLYYSSDADHPNWILEDSVKTTRSYFDGLSSTFTLAPGLKQVVRAQFRFSTATGPCVVGPENDHDDLVFTVRDVTPPIVSISTPTPNQMVAGTVTISGIVQDDIAVNKLQLSIGTQTVVDLPVTSSSWTYRWNSLDRPNGLVDIAVTASDEKGNVSVASESVMVLNDITPPRLSVGRLASPEFPQRPSHG